MESDLRLRAERAIAAHYRSIYPTIALHPRHAGYVQEWHDNLLPGVVAADFEADLRAGDGRELDPRGESPPKFAATFSSSALAINCFGPFRHHPERLSFLGQERFDWLRFEFRCGNGLKGKDPNLDVGLMKDDRIVVIESKFLELLHGKAAAFSAQYEGPFRGRFDFKRIAEDPWAHAYEMLVRTPGAYSHLDAAQLVKHYLGLRHAYADHVRTLVYLFWEPSNAASFTEYSTHRDEVADFASCVAGCDTKFVALTYKSLWDGWAATRLWDGMPAHVSLLRERYLIPI